jgi:hypothetical protein
MIAGLLGTLTAGSSIDVPAPTAYASTHVACPSAKSEAHRSLLVKADEQVEAGDNAGAARSFVAAFDAMDLGNQVAGTGKFTADRAVTAYLDAWRISRDVGLLQEAERFLLRYLETLDQGVGQGCIVDRKWGEDKLAAVRAEMPKEGDPPPGDPEVVVTPAKKDCPPAMAAIIGTDRVGVALTTVGASLFFAGVGLLVTGVALPNLEKPQAFTITGGVVMGVGAAFLVPGVVRLATWRRNKSRARLGVAPWTGHGLAGVTVGGRFGAWR